MRLIIHIGMGKTGTSSIQSVLQQNTKELASQKVCYLGGAEFFDLIAPGSKEPEGIHSFLTGTPKEMTHRGEKMVAAVTRIFRKEGIETFIWSHEHIFNHPRTAGVIIKTLRESIDVEIVMFVRNPHSWLPSAYTQWGVRHKTYPGPIRPYNEHASQLIKRYCLVKQWAETFPDILIVRPYEKGTDVVTSFAKTTGINITTKSKRVLKRSEDAESLLRALFNNRFKDPIRPVGFDNVVFSEHCNMALDIDEMVERIFNRDQTSEIMESNREVFEYINDKFGFDYLGSSDEPFETVDPDQLRKRLMDYLVEITLDQAQRISRLEQRLDKLDPQSQGS